MKRTLSLINYFEHSPKLLNLGLLRATKAAAAICKRPAGQPPKAICVMQLGGAH
jgi:hypothetical protein